MLLRTSLFLVALQTTTALAPMARRTLCEAAAAATAAAALPACAEKPFNPLNLKGQFWETGNMVYVKPTRDPDALPGDVADGAPPGRPMSDRYGVPRSPGSGRPRAPFGPRNESKKSRASASICLAAAAASSSTRTTSACQELFCPNLPKFSKIIAGVPRLSKICRNYAITRRDLSTDLFCPIVQKVLDNRRSTTV